ncbi:DUF2059 domain-containing protein [Cerasicoccus frondis]|uniref:DUF2059 domain-containing protein n=1 Tax=Cerasicoccus frondis TaxID=490090 RepID=UPI002852B155|nr:DUF2059 domain-containing protein [Cerasicoccus frondis]
MKKFFLFLFAALFATAAFADDAGKTAIAKELLEKMSPKATVVESFMSAYEPYMQQIQAMGIPEEAVKKIRAEGLKLANQIAVDPEMMEKMVKLYTDTFTEQELQDIFNFYQTPTGEKALKQFPILFEKGALIGQEVANKYLPEFQVKVQEIMEEAMDVELSDVSADDASGM